MSDRSLRDSGGIVIVLGATLSVANAVSGRAHAPTVLVGVVIALLCIGTFLLQGDDESMQN